MSTAENGEPRYEVLVDGRVHQWSKETISVVEIRELGGFADDAKVAAVDLATNDQRALDEDDVHHVPPLQEGKPLVKRMDFKRAS